MYYQVDIYCATYSSLNSLLNEPYAHFQPLGSAVWSKKFGCPVFIYSAVWARLVTKSAKSVFCFRVIAFLMILLFYYLTPLQNQAPVTSLCMQLHFSEERGKYHCDESALPVTIKEKGKNVSALG